MCIFMIQASFLIPAFAGEKGGNNLTSEFIREIESTNYVYTGCSDLLDRTDEEVIAVCGYISALQPDLARSNKQVQALLKCCPTVLW